VKSGRLYTKYSKWIVLLAFHFSLFTLILSCEQEQDNKSPEELSKEDSLALHVAVMPVMDCLPFYYAEKMRIFEAEGLSVRLQKFNAQMDCDTALQQKHAEVVYTDLARLLLMKEDTRAIMGLPGKLSLITAKTKRIRQLKHLNERMVAVDRLSMTDYWSDELMKQAGLDQTAIYRPQINDLKLRTSMLQEQLVDAALLPEPYAQQAEHKGNKRIFTTNDSTPTLACLASLQQTVDDTLRSQQIEKLFTIYNKTVDILNGKERNKDSLRSIFIHQYNLLPEVADSLVISSFQKARMAKEEDADIAVRWLQSRERYPRKGHREKILCNKFIHP